jgi:hypothetical protein
MTPSAPGPLSLLRAALRRLSLLPLALVLVAPAAPNCGGGSGGGGNLDGGSSSDGGGGSGGGGGSACLSAMHAPVSADPRIVALAESAAAFRRSLSPAVLGEAAFCLEDAQLTSWSYLPVFIAPRKGLQLSELSPSQLLLASKIFDGFLSTQGFDRMYFIIDTLDERLKAMALGFGYGAGTYRISLYNDPATDGAWGIRIEGHHLAITCVVDGDQVYLTPAFFGAEPNTLDNKKVFAAEETLAHDLVAAMSTAHLQKALLGHTAPNDIVTAPGNGGPDAARNFDYTQLAGVGLAAADMTPVEQQKLRALVAEIVSYQEGPFAQAKLAEIDAGFAQTRFAWMGPTDGSDRFYFRIYNPKILIEYDLTTLIGPISTGPNHTHMIIRSPDAGDYGPFAALDEHLRSTPDHLRAPPPARARRDRIVARLARLARRR